MMAPGSIVRREDTESALGASPIRCMMAPGSIVRREDIEALLRKPLEEAVRVPLRAFGTVGHRLRQRAQQVVEAAGALQIYRLFEVVSRRYIRSRPCEFPLRTRPIRQHAAASSLQL